MKKTLLLLSLLSLGVKAQRNQYLDAFSLLTLNPNARIEGPIFENTPEKKQTYSSQLLKIILKNAHEKAKRFLEYGDIQAYNSFLILSLTIPMHEGLYIHFRNVANTDRDYKDVCNRKRNKGSGILSDTSKKHFQDLFLNKKNPFLIPCRKFRKVPMLTQLMSGGTDGSDVGIMQISLRYHYDRFWAKGDFKSVDKSIKYGLKYALHGFKRIYSNHLKYRCLNDQNSKIDYTKLIRGTWSGQYNMGNTGVDVTCRFTDEDSPYKTADQGFLRHIKKILNYPQTLQWGINETLSFKLTKRNEMVLKEVIANFENQTNNRKYLDIILGE